jgi:ribosomal protein L3 glutamine methyltransferase
MNENRSPLDELFTIRDFIRWGASRFIEEALFFGHGTDNAWDEAVVLFLHGLFLPHESDSRILDARLTSPEKKRVMTLLDRRINKRIPAPYITGIARFCDLDFIVDERVLIPRSPIAELIEGHFEAWCASDPKRILDLCCGSACIGIAAAYEFPDAQIDVADISVDALDVAAENIVMHEVEGRVCTVESDLFQGLSAQSYDLIISNPPYVDEEDFNSMPSEYHHEPEIALSSGHDGLDFTRRLLSEAPDHLNEDGVLVVEVGNSWPTLEQSFPDIPFTWINFENGGHGVFVITREQLVNHRGCLASH